MSKNSQEEDYEETGEWWEIEHENRDEKNRLFSYPDGEYWQTVEWLDERTAFITYGDGYYITAKEEIKYDEERRAIREFSYSADGHFEKWTTWRYLPHYTMTFQEGSMEVFDTDENSVAYGDWGDDTRFYLLNLPTEALEDWQREWLELDNAEFVQRQRENENTK